MDNFSIDYSKLKGRIIEVCGNQGEFAKAIGTSDVTLSKRMNSKVLWNGNDIIKACDVLGIKYSQIGQYFFCVRS